MGELNMKEVFAFSDDLMIPARDFQEQLDRLRLVLMKLRLHSLKLSPEKCRFFQTRVGYCGHVVSAEGVEFLVRSVGSKTGQFLRMSVMYENLLILQVTIDGSSRIFLRSLDPWTNCCLASRRGRRQGRSRHRSGTGVLSNIKHLKLCASVWTLRRF